MSVKLDMSKAYNQVEWDYLQCTLSTLNFPQNFIYLIMQCVTLNFYSVLINGTPSGPITPSHRFRQGDSLSPYLFLLYTGGLVCLLKKSTLDRILEGVRVCRRAPHINHLLFTDNSLVFCKATRSSSITLLNLLQTYAQAFRDCIDMDKTTMVFSKNVGEVEKGEIMSLWGGRQTQ